MLAPQPRSISANAFAGVTIAPSSTRGTRSGNHATLSGVSTGNKRSSIGVYFAGEDNNGVFARLQDKTGYTGISKQQVSVGVVSTPRDGTLAVTSTAWSTTTGTMVATSVAGLGSNLVPVCPDPCTKRPHTAR